MLHFELYNDSTGKHTRLGTVGEFVKEVVRDMRKMGFLERVMKADNVLATSKLFTRKVDIDANSMHCAVDLDQLDKEFTFALDRVIQRIRDDRS